MEKQLPKYYFIKVCLVICAKENWQNVHQNIVTSKQ